MKPITAKQLKTFQQLRNRADRQQQGLFLLEGNKLVDEALLADWPLEALCVLRGTQLKNIPLKVAVYDLTSHQMEQLSTLDTAPKILGIAHLPKAPSQRKNEDFILVLEDIQDPGNLGTILRTANWFGLSRLVVNTNTVDPYNEKVVRASMGAILHLAIQVENDLPTYLKDLQKKGYQLVCTDVNEGRSTLPKGKIVLVLGNEGKGVSGAIRELADNFYHIPGSGQGESLNVAVTSGIVLADHFKTKPQADQQG